MAKTNKDYTINEIISKYTIERSRLYTLIRSNTLKSYKINGKLYIPREEIENNKDLFKKIKKKIKEKEDNAMLEVGLLEVKYQLERRHIYALINDGILDYEVWNNKYFIYRESWEKNKHYLIGKKLKEISEEFNIDIRTLKKHFTRNNLKIYNQRISFQDYEKLKKFMDTHYSSGYIRDYFGITKIQLYRAIEAGLCKGEKKFGQWYIEKKSFDPNKIIKRRRKDG